MRFIVHSGRLLFDRVFHIRPVPTGLVCSTNDCILPTEICVKGYYLVHFTSLRYIKTVSDVGSGFHKSLKIFWESCQHSATLSSPHDNSQFYPQHSTLLPLPFYGEIPEFAVCRICAKFILLFDSPVLYKFKCSTLHGLPLLNGTIRS